MVSREDRGEIMAASFSYIDRLEASISGLPALSRKHPEAAVLLDFLVPVLETQRKIASSALPLSSIRDAALPPWSVYLREMASTCAAHGTQEIVSAANRLRNFDDKALSAILTCFINHEELEAAERLVVMSFLGGLASDLPSLQPYDERGWLKPLCPACGMPPVASLLSDVDEIEGCRHLYCGVCHASWHFNRTTCHQCGTNDDHKFDYFHPDGDMSVVIHACRNCMGYLKTIDMRSYSMMVPELLDTATLSLDLYAQEKGFSKGFPNMFGY
jgi:formate dehydrogenase accessory protein FdhE